MLLIADFFTPCRRSWNSGMEPTFPPTPSRLLRGRKPQDWSPNDVWFDNQSDVCGSDGGQGPSRRRWPGLQKVPRILGRKERAQEVCSVNYYSRLSSIVAREIVA